MRLTLLHVVSLLALVMSALSDSVASSPRVCTIKLEDDGNSMYSKLGKMASGCFGTFIDQFEEVVGLLDHTTFFKNMCDKKQQIRECLVEVELTSKVCQNVTSHQNLKLLTDLLKTTLYSGCVEDGEVLASMAVLYKVYPNDPFTSNPFGAFRECLHLSARIARAMFLLNQDLTIPSAFYVLYRSVNNIKHCFGNVVDESVDLVPHVIPIFSEITNKMECVHPQDGTTVLCKTIDITLPDVPRLCPIKSENEEETSVYDILGDQIGWCVLLYRYRPEGSMDMRFGEIHNIDMARTFMNHQCRKKPLIEQCWSDVMTSSSVCLDGIEQNLIKVGVDQMQKPLESVCREQGQSLGYLINKVISEKNMTEDSKDAIDECVRVAGRLNEGLQKSSGAEKILLNYRRLKVFNECFINKMRGDNRAVLNTMDLLNLVQRNMECVDEQNGNIVLCEGIDTTPETGNEVCPLVGEEENEPPEYDLIIDQGFKCLRQGLKAVTLKLGRFVEFTSIEEFRTFFKTFCHNRMTLKHCVEDVTSLSKICQNQTNHQMLSIFTDFLETTLENSCKQDGEVMATILHGFMSGAAVDRDSMNTCLEDVSIQLKNTSLKVENLSSQSLLLYSKLESMKGCLIIGNANVDTFKTVFVSFVNDILINLKCVHPDDGTTVLCKTIVNN